MCLRCRCLISPIAMAGNTPKCLFTSCEYWNESIALYGIDNCDPEYSNVRAVLDDVPILPIAP